MITLIKKKSLVVALISSFVISLVLVMTLIGYAVYLELKDEELKQSYNIMLEKVNARVYSKYIEIARLSAAIEPSGALKGQPVVEGILRNRGYRDILDIILRVKFLDQDGAIMYEVIFHPQEPALGSSILTQVAIPYLSEASKTQIRPEGSLPFKRILAGCPPEILSGLKNDRPSGKSTLRWSGRLDYDVLSVTF